MKNLKKILFTFMFMFLFVFEINNVSALTINKIYKDSTGVITSGSDKVDFTIISGNDNYNTAADIFYANGFGTAEQGYVEMVPFKFDVKQSLDSGNVVLYVKIPESFIKSHATDAEAIKKIRLTRLQLDNGVYKFAPVFGTQDYRSAVDANNNFEVVRGSVSGNSFTASDSGDYYAKITTNLKDYADEVPTVGSTVYYALTICYTAVPTVPTTTTTTIPESTTTTTVENPKTLDASNQGYIAIGVLGLLGIVGLGIKFAKSSK